MAAELAWVSLAQLCVANTGLECRLPLHLWDTGNLGKAQISVKFPFRMEITKTAFQVGKKCPIQELGIRDGSLLYLG